MALRHRIQHWGHEYIPVLFMAACIGSTFLFFLGHLYNGVPPWYILLPVAALFAVCVEMTTLTFGQDMQDCITDGNWAQFFLALPKALATYAAGTFFLANASAMFWAPRDALLGIDAHVWAWVMAIFVFGVQFLVKLAPEHEARRHAQTQGKTGGATASNFRRLSAAHRGAGTNGKTAARAI
jgi:hypothetical protein